MQYPSIKHREGMCPQGSHSLQAILPRTKIVPEKVCILKSIIDGVFLLLISWLYI